MAQNLARLGVVLGIDTAQFTSGLQKAKQSLSQIGDFAVKAGAVAGAALTAMTYKAMQFADEMSDLSDATGISIAKILQLSNASQRAGGNFEGGSKAITKFIQNIDAAASGSDAMQKSFAKAGVSLEDLANLSEAELIDKVSLGITKLGTESEKTGVKMDLFGKSMRTVKMDIFNKYIQEGTEEFLQYEAAITAAADLTDKFERASNKLGLTFIKNVMPPLTKFFEVINVDGGIAEKVFEGIGNIIYGATITLQRMQTASEQIGIIWSFIKRDISFDDMNKQLMNADNNFALAIHSLREYRREAAKGTNRDTATGNAGRTIEQGAEAKKAAEAAKKEAEKQAEMLKVAKLISDEYNRQQAYSIQQLKIRNQMLGMTQDERRIQEAINQVTDETSRKIDEITKKREDAAGRGGGPEVLAEYDKQIAKIVELQQVYIETAMHIETTSIASQRTFAYGWDVAFNQFAENAYNYATMAEEVFTTLTGNMTEAINTFVDTGKFSFSDFAQSVIKDLIKIQLRMQMMQLFSMAIGGIGGMMGGGGPQPLGNMGGAGFSARASGGSVTQDTPYMVGERGAELFVPQRSGTIIPNHQLSAAMGGGSGTTINGPYIASMNAIDTQSGIQFLAKNKMTIWSMNQSANRSIPAGR
jgi:lambda family phage tail tape measure protein